MDRTQPDPIKPTQPGCIEQLALVAHVTDSLGTLPAVATLDWCDQLATRLCALLEPSLALVVVGTVTPSGELVEREAAGAGGSKVLQSESARGAIGSLRAGADRVRSIGWTPSGQGLSRGEAGRLGTLYGGDWRGSPAGGLWAGLGAGDVLAGLFPLSTGGGGRSLIVQIGALDPDDRQIELATGPLAALLPMAARRLVIAVGESAASGGRWLTAREQQVLEELSLGKSVREIAESVDRSPHTVHDHVKSLHRKLGASSRGELVARALGHLAADVVTPTAPAIVRTGSSACEDRADPALASSVETTPRRAAPLGAR